MVRWILGLCLVMVCLAGTPARAAVISRDWKTPGDGLLTYDDVNQREWLDLTQSALSQFPGSTREAKFQQVVLQTQSGGMFAGFRVAAGSEASALATSAGIDTLTDSYALNASPATSLVDLLGRTIRPSLTYASGLLLDVEVQRLGAEVFAFPTSGSMGKAGLSINGGSDLLFMPLPGVWLVRVVPEPNCNIVLFAIAMVVRKAHRKWQCAA